MKYHRQDKTVGVTHRGNSKNSPNPTSSLILATIPPLKCPIKDKRNRNRPFDYTFGTKSKYQVPSMDVCLIRESEIRIYTAVITKRGLKLAQIG